MDTKQFAKKLVANIIEMVSSLPNKKHELYIETTKNISELVVNSSNPSVERLVLSDYRWEKTREKRGKWIQVKAGDIYQIEFGKNYVPEMSYEHRGMILGRSGQLLYVLPIYSYQSEIQEHKEAYHPIDNPTNLKSNLYLMKKGEFGFLNRDSVLKLNDLRSVSVKRILYKNGHGRIEANSEVFKMIEGLAIRKHFSEFYYQNEKLKKAFEDKEMELDKMLEENKLLSIENEKLKKEIEQAEQKNS